jgi:hypothetical protein
VNSSGVVDAATCAPVRPASTITTTRKASIATHSSRPQTGSFAHSTPSRDPTLVTSPNASPIASDPAAPTASHT